MATLFLPYVGNRILFLSKIPNHPIFPICGDPISPICHESNALFRAVAPLHGQLFDPHDLLPAVLCAADASVRARARLSCVRRRPRGHAPAGVRAAPSVVHNHARHPRGTWSVRAHVWQLCTGRFLTRPFSPHVAPHFSPHVAPHFSPHTSPDAILLVFSLFFHNQHMFITTRSGPHPTTGSP